MEQYKITPLGSQHDKRNFECGIDLFDNYIRKQANQDIKRKLSICFVLSNKENIVMGYYTLSNAEIPRRNLPSQISKKLPKSYSEIPGTLLGRLAIDKSISGKGFGELLLIDALKKSYEVAKYSIGSLAVIVDPINEDAERFYIKYGFIKLPDSGKMFIAMKTISELFGG
jgi:predicted GNAT family N-acyltransferase